MVHDGESWSRSTGAWDGVVGLVLDRDRFEVLTSGFLDNLAGLTPGEVTYSGTTPLFRAVSPTRALILSQHAAGGTSSSGGGTTTVINTTVTVPSNLYVLKPLAGGVLDIDAGNLVFDIDTLEQVTY